MCLPFQPDYSEAVDDPIATALRHAQRELRTVLATNKVRRARLAAIAEDRLAYQEYVDGRDAIDKNIQTLYGKLQKKDGPKVSKKKKQKGDPPPGMNGNSGLTGMAALPPCPAALGLSPDEHSQLHVPEQLFERGPGARTWRVRSGANIFRWTPGPWISLIDPLSLSVLSRGN